MSIQAFLDLMEQNDSGSETPAPAKEGGTVAFPFPLPPLRSIERAAIDEALERVQGNQSAAARMLGVSRQTINRHLSRARSADDQGLAGESQDT